MLSIFAIQINISHSPTSIYYRASCKCLLAIRPEYQWNTEYFHSNLIGRLQLVSMCSISFPTHHVDMHLICTFSHTNFILNNTIHFNELFNCKLSVDEYSINHVTFCLQHITLHIIMFFLLVSNTRFSMSMYYHYF